MVIMNISALWIDYFDKSGDQDNGINTFVANAVAYVVNNYFLSVAPSFALTLCTRNRHTENFYNNMLEILFRVWGSPMLQFINVLNASMDRVPGERHYNLLLLDSFVGFTEIDVISYTASYNWNEYYYIFLQARDHLLPAEMERIFRYCWHHHLINCTIQIQTAKGEILVYTYFPYTPEYCGASSPVLINQFNGTAMVVADLFPNKLRNFYGCPLRAALWDVPPFLSLETYANNTTQITGGFEGTLLLELARYLNFSIEIIIPPNNEQRGRIGNNNTLTGALNMLQKRIVDFSCGCFRQSAERSLVATPTKDYYQTSQAIVIPVAAYDLTSFEILRYPYNEETWLLLGVIAAFGVPALFAIHRIATRSPHLLLHYHWRLSYLNILLIMVGLPAAWLPERNFGRVLCMNWMIFTLILRTCYQALLFHLIRTHIISRLPSSVAELAMHNFTIVLNTGTYDSLKGIAIFHNMEVLSTSSETAAFEYIEDVHERNIAAAGPYDFLNYYVKSNKKAGVFKNMVNVVNLQTTIYMTKHSFLIDQFDSILMWIRGTGLIERWARMELDDKYLASSHMRRDRILGLDELKVLFFAGSTALGVAILVFLLEILSMRFRLLRGIF